MRQSGNDAAKLPISRQPPLAPMVVFAIGIKYALDVGLWEAESDRQFSATGIFATNRSHP
jgi:hypothetical protein